MSEEIPKAIAELKMDLFGRELKVYVLDNGQRIIDVNDLHALMDAMSENSDAPESEL